MIYSELSLSQIEAILNRYGSADDFSSLRIIRNRDQGGEWRDTNRTVVLISPRLYDQLIRANFHRPTRSAGRPPYDLRLIPYQIRDTNLPKDGQKKDLFVRIPEEVHLSSTDVEAIINAKMNAITTFGLLGDNDYTVKIPLRSKNRTTDQVSGASFIAFGPTVTVEAAAQVKAIIDDTFWGDTPHRFNCYWALEQKPRLGDRLSEAKRLVYGAVKVATGKKPFYKNEINSVDELAAL